MRWSNVVWNNLYEGHTGQLCSWDQDGQDPEHLRSGQRVILHHEHVSSTCPDTCLSQTKYIVSLLLLLDIYCLMATWRLLFSLDYCRYEGGHLLSLRMTFRIHITNHQREFLSSAPPLLFPDCPMECCGRLKKIVWIVWSSWISSYCNKANDHSSCWIKKTLLTPVQIDKILMSQIQSFIIFLQHNVK